MSEWHTYWTFETPRFAVCLDLEYQHDYRYDGDDEDGETQDALDSGELVAFDSRVVVYLKGPNGNRVQIASDYLGGSVYNAIGTAAFWTAHRTSDASGRNCSMNSYRVVHYFPDMVRQAVKLARETIPTLRAR